MTAERNHVKKPSPDGDTAAFDKNRRFELADLLRDCAALVEQDEMDQKVFQKMFVELTAYVQVHGGGAAAPTPPVPSAPPTESDKKAASSTSITNSDAPTPPSTNHKTPADPPGISRPPTNSSARKVTTTTTTKHVPPPPSSTSSRGEKSVDTHGALSKEKSHNLLNKIRNNVKEIGHEFTHIAHTGQRALSQAAKNATSAKNAQRAKADIASELHGEEWCEEHFTMGCACKTKKRVSHDARSTTGSVSASTNNTGGSTPRPSNPSKPPFQRPVNPNSTLIANGWLEQQRRSKMRTVWKEVLVSLVAGRRAGEETTLWVQRETHHPVTGAAELEALHQIPIKGMQDVNYVDFSTDHRFIIQVYNLSDEFIFRTRDNGDAAKNWVSTLRLTREAILNGVPPPKAEDLQGGTRRTKTYPGYSEDEKKAESPPAQHQQQHPQPQTSRKLSVKDLRSIAHAHGVKTAGMERGELEAVVAKIQQQSGGRVTPHPPAGPPPSSVPKSDSADEDKKRRAEEESQREAQRLAREREKKEAEQRARQMKLDEETAAKLAAEERTEAERRRQMEAEKQRRAQAEAEERRRAEYLRQQELHRQQQAQAAAQQKWQEEQRRKAAEEQQRRYQQQQQQQQYYAQQQAQWKQQQQTQWNQQQQQHPQWNQQKPHPQWNQQQQQQQHPQWNQHQQNQRHQTPPPQHAPRPGPPPPQPGGTGAAPPGASTNKWVNMAAEDDSDGGSQATITHIKHNILVQWALQPPRLQMLRPIEALLTSIHTVFPPNLGVAGHDYFKKWKPVTVESVTENGRPEESKLAKAVKKLRFFLHPDKLPRDLNDEQSFVCKMLWDITSDAWEEYEKKKEDLDWLNAS